jgi:hypothetical protein
MSSLMCFYYQSKKISEQPYLQRPQKKNWEKKRNGESCRISHFSRRKFFCFSGFSIDHNENRDPHFDVSFPPPCDQNFSITAITVIQKFIVKMRGDRSSSFIVKKARISLELQVHLDSLRTRVVSLETWILQIIVSAIITWETSTMVPVVLRDTGPYLWHTCPTRHLKVQTKFTGTSVGHSERVFLFVYYDGNRVDLDANITQCSYDHLRDTLSVDHRRETHGSIHVTHGYLFLFTFPLSMLCCSMFEGLMSSFFEKKGT